MQQAAPPQPPALAPGTMLSDRYLIQGYIGGGGFGHIYMAHDKVLGHRRAIKEAFYRDPNTQRQFQLEGEFLINARHPNLVQGYMLFEQGGRFYLVMDYVDGFTLEDLTIQQIRRTGHPLTETQILDWIIPICDAVQALHQQPTPIIHRDIKPANIKLNRRGLPVLIDLGLAKLYYRGAQTIGAALAFTPGYAPPEQYQASGATDQRTDVYGMGATLYYLLTGYQPTEAPARLTATTLPAPRKLNPALSQSTETAILRAMSLDPAARQQTMHALMGELQAARAVLTSGKMPVALPDEERRIPCTRCGTANGPVARFCMRCGQPLLDGAGAAKNNGLHLVADGSFADPNRTQAQLQMTPPAPPAQPARSAFALPAMPAVAPAPAQVDASPLPARLQRPHAVPSPYATFPATISRHLFKRVTAQEEGALTLIAAVLGAVTLALSLLAVVSGWLLIFTIPAVLLAGWSCWNWVQEPEKTPAEFKWTTVITLVISGLWILLYFLLFHLHH